MSEQEPRRRPVDLRFGERVVRCEWHNTTLFIHGEADQKYDHIFLVQNPNPEEAEEGFVYFRQQFPQFDSLLDMFRHEGYTFIEKETVTDGDREVYEKHYGEDEPEPAPEVVFEELTPRQNRRVAYLAYLLDQNYLTANDFNIEGDVLI
jgi:hypothetical protein